MRWLRVVVSVAAGGALLACEPPPTATGEVDVGSISMGRGNNNGAVVIRGAEGCALVDGNGEFFFVRCGTEVATFSPNGNATVMVQASGVPNPTGNTVHWGPYNPGQDWEASYPELDGPPFPCFVLGTEGEALFTVNWKATVTPSGQATLVCHYSEKWEFEFPT